MPGSYLVEAAGPALDISEGVSGEKLLQISGATTYPSHTKLYMTTVSAFGTASAGVSGAQALYALLDSEQELVPVRALYSPEETASQVERRNAQAMVSSQDSGTVAGLEAAGYTTTMTLRVEGTQKSGPAEGKLVAGDRLTWVHVGETRTEISSFASLSQLLAATPPGTQVEVGFEREGSPHSALVTTAAYEADATGWVRPGSQLGIFLAVSDVNLPINVTYGIENVGGPSAGSMFALAIYDRLTEGSLGGDAKIAGTGTMSYNGMVGAIGGITHKMVGAARSGARYFLAPALNCSEVVGNVPGGMSVFAVRTIEDSIAATRAIGVGDTSKLTTCEQVVAATPSS